MRKYAACFLAWTVLAFFMFSQDLAQRFFSHDQTPWWRILAAWLTGIYICALLSIGVLWLGRRFPIERRNWLRRTALHLVFSLCFSFIDLALASAELPYMRVLPPAIRTFGSTFAVLLVVQFHQTILMYWTVLGIQYGLNYYRRYQEREQQALRLELHTSALKTELIRAHLSALKMQLHPHFLFNTLNAIMVLVRQQKGRQAEEMLARLSDLLRCVLEDVEAQEVPLRRELEYLQLYLSIEEVRFQDRLRVEISADPSVLDAAVPHMGLQPIVENAIRHGIGRSSAAGRIQISASRANEKLEVKIQDDGPGFPPAGSSPSRGIGLANTRERLHQLYGDRGQLVIENGDPGGAIVTMLLPYHLAPGISETEVMEVHALDDVAR
jgi:sensor histidine kinase YesM